MRFSNEQHEYEFLARLVDPETFKEKDVTITIDGGRLAIQIDKYGDKCSVDGEGSPIVVDFYNYRLKVLVWADINKEDPTHSIDLDGDKEDKRVEDHNKAMKTQDDA